MISKTYVGQDNRMRKKNHTVTEAFEECIEAPSAISSILKAGPIGAVLCSDWKNFARVKGYKSALKTPLSVKIIAVTKVATGEILV
jgi:hypothetical protein